MGKMRTAVYPGSFDPITIGHIDILKRIAPQFDHLIVLVSISPEKKSLFTVQERVEFLHRCLGDYKHIKIDSFEGLTIDYCRKVNAQVIVRGLRAVVDFEYEMTMASMNKKLAPEIETMLIFSNPETYFISSRGVKEVARFRGNLDGLVPNEIVADLKKRIEL